MSPFIFIASHLYVPALRVWRQLLLMTLLGCVVFVASSQANAKGRPAIVRVRAECVVRQDKLFLGDIAQVVSEDSEVREGLRAITLGYAPEVGALRELSREKIGQAIAAAGFGPGAVALEAPEITVVRREVQLVDPGLIREAVERATLPKLRSNGITARLMRLDLPPRIEVRTGVVEVRAGLGGVRNLFAPFMVSIELWIDGRIARRFSTTAQVEAFAPVVVAAHDLADKTRLRAGDFVILPRKLERDPLSYVNNPLQLRGVSLTRALSRGEPITTDAFVPAIVVKPGDPVRITGESGSMKVLVAGEARAAGHVGDRIQVKNLQSGMLFQAVIVDEGVVSVRF